MEVARKNYYQTYETKYEEINQPVVKRKIQPRKQNRLHRVMVCFAISGFLAMGLFLVIRYATITELKHSVNILQKELDQTETQRERLRVELERVSKSRAIEYEAKNRLGMVYPQSDNTFYFRVDATEVRILSKQLEKTFDIDNQTTERNSLFTRTINRVIALLKI